MDLLTLPQAKEKAAVIQGFESWASYEKYCKVTDVVKAYPLKMVAMCDVYANLIIKERDFLKKLLDEVVRELDNSQPFLDLGETQYHTNKRLIARIKQMPIFEPDPRPSIKDDYFILLKMAVQQDSNIFDTIAAAADDDNPNKPVLYERAKKLREILGEIAKDVNPIV